MPTVFISYRHEDTKAETGRLYERLVSEFGQDSVFRDVHSLEPGTDFEQAIYDKLETSDVCLAIIGVRWLDSDPVTGRRRMQPDDFVRRELEIALKLGRRIIPVLIEPAALPSKRALPKSLRPLRRFQAIELTDSRWDYDVSRLIDALIGGDRGVRRWGRALIVANAAAAVVLTLRLTCPLMPWSVLFSWTLDNILTIIGVCGGAAAVVAFVMYGARQDPTRGVAQLLRNLQSWSEERPVVWALVALLAVLAVLVFTVPAGISIAERKQAGPAPNDFCDRYSVDSRMDSQQTQQCPGDRNVGECGGPAFKCDYYDVRIFTGIVPISRLQATIAISGISMASVGKTADVTWSDGAIERVPEGIRFQRNHAGREILFDWNHDGREILVDLPQGAIPLFARVLATRQHNPDTPLTDVDITVRTIAGAGDMAFSRSRRFRVKQ